MAGIVLRFIAWLGTQIWRYGLRVVNAIIAWVRANWRRVQHWIESSVAYGTIVQWILDILGLG